MYDLPQHVAADLDKQPDPNYQAYRRFTELFLRDWAVR